MHSILSKNVYTQNNNEHINQILGNRDEDIATNSGSLFRLKVFVYYILHEQKMQWKIRYIKYESKDFISKNR